MSSSDDLSIIEYYSANYGYRCGYCKSPNTNFSHGMWAHSLTVQDYQDLVDRGWRRSGCYCYKPTMHLTCCPMYTIKCSAIDFKLSKSQKKKLKQFHNFLAHGKKRTSQADDGTSESASESGDETNAGCGISDVPDLKEKAERALQNVESAKINSVDEFTKHRLAEEDNSKPNVIAVAEGLPPSVSNASITSSTGDSSTTTSSVEASVTCAVTDDGKEAKSKSLKKGIRPGDGMDPNRPQCKKAKLLRQERKEKKLTQLGILPVSSQKTKPLIAVKSLEDFIHEPLPDSPAHRLELKLVNVKSSEFSKTFKDSWALFAKYQMAIHKEEPDECDKATFKGFLIDSPFEPWKPKDGPPQGYGSFHQQYWLDDRLIAVGVIDILPYCVSSVYFYYDPEFHFLVLGTYGSLREIAFCRSLHHIAPDLRYYYMGFYIHSCLKMRYKGQYSPSFLLCPETYSWHPIEDCIPLLERSRYCRFNEDPETKDPDGEMNIREVTVLFHNKGMTYQSFLAAKPSSSHHDEVTEYVSLVGKKLAKRMFLLLT